MDDHLPTETVFFNKVGDYFDARKALADTTSGTELLAEIARLRRNQRTAGMIEVCTEIRSPCCGWWHNGHAVNCEHKDCPIRNKKESI